MSSVAGTGKPGCCKCCCKKGITSCCDDVTEPDPAKKKRGCCACLKLRFYQYRIVTGMYVLDWWEAVLLNVLLFGLLYLLGKCLLNIGPIFSQYGAFAVVMCGGYYTLGMYYNTENAGAIAN